MEAECHNNTGGEPEHGGERSGSPEGSKGGSFYEAVALSPQERREPPTSPAGAEEDLQTSAEDADVSLPVIFRSAGRLHLVLLDLRQTRCRYP